MYLVVDNERQIHLDWVNAILSKKNWRPNRLATEARLDPSALSRFLKDPTGKRKLNSYTIEKIEAASGVPAFETEFQPENARRNIAVGDAEPLEGVHAGPLDRAIRAIKQDANAIDAWILRTRCLENAGFLPGDVLMIDMNAKPKRGDIVVAQVYDRNGQAETVIRMYEHPFLITATMDQQLLTPILIDKNVVVRGTLLTSLRERRAA